jgi:hypothetical protein
MRKSIAAASLAATLAVGGTAGMLLVGPGLAGAQTSTDSTTTADSGTTATPAAPDGSNWVQDALAGLVTDGTLTQAQADAVQSALDAARPADLGHRGGGFGHVDLSTVATALGISEDDLRTALDAGSTIADVAAQQGVDVQTVIDAIVADQQAHVADEVADGRITQDQADQILADAATHATDVVNGTAPAFGGDHAPGGPGGFGGHGPMGTPPADAGTSTTDATATAA